MSRRVYCPVWKQLITVLLLYELHDPLTLFIVVDFRKQLWDEPLDETFRGAKRV